MSKMCSKVKSKPGVYVILRADGIVVYVGATSNLAVRFAQHVDRLKLACALGLPPTFRLKVLEVCRDKKSAHRREQYWLKRYRSDGAPLVNLHGDSLRPVHVYFRIAAPVKATLRAEAVRRRVGLSAVFRERLGLGAAHPEAPEFEVSDFVV